MNRKRNVAFSKPEDPDFLKRLKKQVGYDDRNHKFDELENSEKDFVSDEDDEQPQVVVIKKGDLTAEQAEEEKKRKEKLELETKADLNQRIIFKSKTITAKKDLKKSNKSASSLPKSHNLLSFNHNDDDNDECNTDE